MPECKLLGRVDGAGVDGGDATLLVYARDGAFELVATEAHGGDARVSITPAQARELARVLHDAASSASTSRHGPSQRQPFPTWETARRSHPFRITSMQDDPKEQEWLDVGRDFGHPYRWRTWLRGKLPWFLIDLGLANKGRDCEAAGAWHRWYNQDGVTSACYHCRVVREGRLWEDEA